MNKKEFSFLSETFIFKGLTEQDMKELPKEMLCQTPIFFKGEHVDLSVSESKKIAFILSGECTVMKEGLVMNTLKKGDSFGILSVFSSEPYPTAVIAKKETKILFLERDDLIMLIEKSPKIAMNVITFLAGRVTFLNAKIATLSGITVEDKCVAYLKEEYKKHGDSIPFPISAVARKIRAGRASLYRAIAALEKKGILEYKDNLVRILYPNFVKKQKEKT